MKYNAIKNLMEEKKITVRKICHEINMTESGFWKMINNRSIKIDTLEKIAKVLDVPVNYFFEEETAEPIIISKPRTKGNENFEVVLQLRLNDETKASEILKIAFGNEFLKVINK